MADDPSAEERKKQTGILNKIHQTGEKSLEEQQAWHDELEQQQRVEKKNVAKSQKTEKDSLDLQKKDSADQKLIVKLTEENNKLSEKIQKLTEKATDDQSEQTDQQKEYEELKKQKDEKSKAKKLERDALEQQHWMRLEKLGWESEDDMDDMSKSLAKGLELDDTQLEAMGATKNVLAEEAREEEIREAKKKKKEDEDKVLQISQEKYLRELFTLGEWNKDFAERQAKKVMQMKASVDEWWKKKKDDFKSLGMGLLEALIKGAGLFLLWKLFKWLAKQDLKGLYETVVTAWTTFWNGITALRVWWMMLGERLKKTKFGRWITKTIKAIRVFFGGSGALWKIMVALIKFFGPNTTMGRFSTKILEFILRVKKGFKDLMKPIVKLMKAFGFVGKVSGLGGVLKFLKGIMKIFGKLFLPISLLMGAWAAISGGLDEAAEESGGFPQKILSFISGALKGLLDFFIFDLAALIQDGIKWAIGWFMGLFGFSEEEIEKATDWDLVGTIKDAVFGAIDWVRDLFRFDGKGIKFDGLAPLIDILMWPLNKAIDWVRELFGWKEEGEEDFSIGKLVTGVLNDIFAWFKSLLDIDFTAMLKKIPGAGMVMDLLGGGKDSKSKADLTKMGLIDEDLIGKDDLELEKIKKEIENQRKKGGNLAGLMNALTNIAKDESIDAGDRKKLAKILKAEGATLATGGLFSGGMALVGEGGPEIMMTAKPAKVIPAKQTADLMSGMGGGTINAPTIVNSAPASTTMIASSSSLNPVSQKYFRSD